MIIVTKSLRALGLAVVVGALLSCGVFFAPLEERLNPSDPVNSVDKYVYPVVDGSIDANNASDFGSALLRVWYGTPMTDGLLRFDPADFPARVDSATLELYMSAGSAGDIVVFRIVQDWVPTSLAWSDVTSSSFRDPDTAMDVTLNMVAVNQYYSINATDLIKKSLAEGRPPGLLLNIGSTANFDFHSTRGPNKPRLRVTGSLIP